MKSIISNISESFISEAKASPRMLEDLAAMEKYMSESYDGRTFVELIQNADDAKASRIRVEFAGNTLIVANDGRCFDENDIQAICRSGSSNKQRGTNIGYRGVGFKSATTISNEIVIYSSKVFFSFSKSKCAKELGMTESKVPTVRIPFMSGENELEQSCILKIEELESEGFNTIFLFKNPRLEKFLDELNGFNNGWLLFLRNITSAEIALPSLHRSCKVSRKIVNGKLFVKTIGEKEQWVILSRDDVSIAFRYDDVKGVIPCPSDDGVFHCYLPTIDKTGFPFKVNADFSTDPSRKHLIMDELTRVAMDNAAMLFADCLFDVSENEDKQMVSMLELLITHTSLGEVASRFEQKLNNYLHTRKWVLRNDDTVSEANEVVILPNWFDEEEKNIIEDAHFPIGERLYKKELYSTIDKIEKILSKYGAKEVSQEELRILITDVSKAQIIGEKVVSKIFTHCLRALLNNKDYMSLVFIPTTAGFIRLCEVKNVEEIGQEFISLVTTTFSDKEKDTLIEEFPVLGVLKTKTAITKKTTPKAMKLPSMPINMAINKWKTPIQNCLAAEIMEGRSGKDVSRKCDEYDIESVDAQGNAFYVAVKSVKVLGDAFVLSERQYAAAQRLGEAYKLFVISSEGEKSKFLYISDPVNELKMDKTVKEWEFVCNEYELPEMMYKDESNDLVDERFMKNISAEYFTSVQKKFLQEYLLAENVMLSADNQVMIESINSVVDFYTGECLFEIKDNNILVEKTKLNAIRTILS